MENETIEKIYHTSFDFEAIHSHLITNHFHLAEWKHGCGCNGLVVV